MSQIYYNMITKKEMFDLVTASSFMRTSNKFFGQKFL